MSKEPGPSSLRLQGNEPAYLRGWEGAVCPLVGDSSLNMSTLKPGGWGCALKQQAPWQPQCTAHCPAGRQPCGLETRL